MEEIIRQIKNQQEINFINPCDYVYEGEKLFEIPENLSIIDSEREGYVNDSSIIIERKKLFGSES